MVRSVLRPVLRAVAAAGLIVMRLGVGVLCVLHCISFCTAVVSCCLLLYNDRRASGLLCELVCFAAGARKGFCVKHGTDMV